MAGKILSIEIGYTVTKFCLTDYKARNPRVYRYARIRTPENVMQDGELNPTEEYITLLYNTIAENRLHSKQVIFSVTSPKIASREVIVPFVKDDRIPALVKANAGDYFPVDLDQYELGHLVLGTTEDNLGNKKLRLLVLAAPKILVESYRKLAEALNMRLAAIDYSGNSIYQIIKNDCKEGVQMVIKADEQSAILTILKDQSIVLQRSVPYGVDEAIQTIQSNRAFEVYHYNDALDLASRKTCISLSLNARELLEAEEEDVESLDLMTARQSVTESLGMLINGINRVMDYYSSRNPGMQIEKIFLTGLGARIVGLNKLLTNELGIRVSVLNKLESYNIDRYFREGKFGEYVACVGAVIAPVGFVTTEKQRKNMARKSGSSDMTGAAWLLLTGGVLIAITLLAVSILSLKTQKEEYSANLQRLEELQEIREIYAQYNAMKSSYEDVRRLYACTETYNEALLDFISEMEEKMPSDIHVLTMNAGLDSVSMNIEVNSKEEMANTIQQLRSFESLANITVAGAQDTVEDSGNRKVSFTINCFYKTRQELEAGKTGTEG